MSARRFFAKKVVASDMQLATTWRTVRDFIAVAVAPLGERRKQSTGLFLCRLPAANAAAISRSRFESFSGKSKKLNHGCGSAFLAHCEGLEPPTFWFVARHSIQLS